MASSISRCGGDAGCCPERAIMKRPKTGEQVKTEREVERIESIFFSE